MMELVISTPIQIHFGIHDMIGNANEWVDSCFDIRSSNLSEREMFSSDHWLSTLSRERILKPVGVFSRFPHPGRRSVMTREYRLPLSHCGGTLSRESLAGFRCAYDL